MHATTIYHLRQGTEISELKINFFDQASARIIARSILEIYLVMFETFFEPKTDDLLEFHFTRWQLLNLVERKKSIQKIPYQDLEYQNEVVKLQQQIQEMKNRIRATEKFTTLTTKQQDRVAEGEKMSLRSREDILRACGLGAKTFNTLYYVYSAYVHPDELSLTHIIDADSREKQIEKIESTMSQVAMIMAKMILNYEQTFPEVKNVCEENPDFLLAESWAEAASRLD